MAQHFTRLQRDAAAARPSNAGPALSPLETERETVYKAIKDGAHTQDEMMAETGVNEMVLGRVLADLLLWQRRIVTKTIDDARFYFAIEDTDASAA